MVIILNGDGFCFCCFIIVDVLLKNKFLKFMARRNRLFDCIGARGKRGKSASVSKFSLSISYVPGTFDFAHLYYYPRDNNDNRTFEQYSDF